MKHLVEPLAPLPLSDAKRQLLEAHDFLVTRHVDALATMPKSGQLGGIQMKRLSVDLKSAVRPAIVRHSVIEGILVCVDK